MIRNEDLPLAEKDNAAARVQELATVGDVNARYLMGRLWRDNPLMIPDAVEARYWFELAAKQDHDVAQYAQYMLGKLYLVGDEMPSDKERAIYWLTQSAAQGNVYVRFLLSSKDGVHSPSTESKAKLC